MFMKESLDGAGPGATEVDIRFITQNLQLMERKDSTERGIRPSTWFTLQKKPAMKGR
jgi:hypothetical protein